MLLRSAKMFFFYSFRSSSDFSEFLPFWHSSRISFWDSPRFSFRDSCEGFSGFHQGFVNELFLFSSNPSVTQDFFSWVLCRIPAGVLLYLYNRSYLRFRILPRYFAAFYFYSSLHEFCESNISFFTNPPEVPFAGSPTGNI